MIFCRNIRGRYTLLQQGFDANVIVVRFRERERERERERKRISPEKCTLLIYDNKA